MKRTESYDLPTEARRYSGERASATPHLASEVLADLAAGLSGGEAVSLANAPPHLRECPRCFAEFSVAVAAIDASRRSRGWIGGLVPRGVPTWGLPAAAAVLLLAGVFVVAIDRRVPDSYRLHGGELTGVQMIEARNELLVEASSVGSGASVTLRSGNIVALGEGFSVRENGKLGIQVTPGATGRGS